MKITYTSVTGQIHEIEVDDSWGAVILELDREEKNLDRKETRRHTALDSYDFIDTDAGSNPCLSRDAFEYRNHLCTGGRDILADLERHYTQRHIREAVEKLKPAQCDLITAIYFDGLSVNDYAKKEGVDHSAISHRLQTAHKNLKKLL
jgi:DNA-directed RNA polymerase specialized sigma24 family protein